MSEVESSKIWNNRGRCLFILKFQLNNNGGILLLKTWVSKQKNSEFLRQTEHCSYQENFSLSQA